MGIDDLSEEIDIEPDSESISSQTDKQILNCVSRKANRNRICGKERRKFKYTAHFPGRRSGIDRRGIGWYRI